MLVVETIAKIRLAYFSRKMTIKGDLPRFACFAQSGSEGHPVAGDRVPLSARRPTPAEDRALARAA